jgi:DNA repair ATPase RecN
MTRETLTENMRRLSNIVTEAEQLDELRNPLKAIKTVGNAVANFGKKGKKPSTQTVRTALDNITLIIDDVMASVPVETAVKINRMNRMGLSRDAKVKLMEIANQHLDKIARKNSQAIELVPQIKNTVKKVLKASIDADADPRTISRDMRKILRKYEQNGDLSIQGIFQENRSQLLQKLTDRNSAAMQAVPYIVMSYYAVVIATIITVINVGYNDPGAKARRQVRKDQDFLGPDDDAPLSQGERGAREQGLYDLDDNQDPFK